MTNGELYDMFVAPDGDMLLIARMTLMQAAQHVGELREDRPDKLALSDRTIAARVLYHAQTNALEHCVYCHADVPFRESWPMDADEAWQEIARDHAAGCEWVATRAHGLEATDAKV